MVKSLTKREMHEVKAIICHLDGDEMKIGFIPDIKKQVCAEGKLPIFVTEKWRSMVFIEKEQCRKNGRSKIRWSQIENQNG